MSVWTHVAGLIRFDAIRIFETTHPTEWIGPTNLWDEDNDTSTIPSGSEGSLEYTVIENPEMSALSAYAVSIYGDLRDFSNELEIFDWLNTITEGRMVRQGIVTCSIENAGTFVFVFNEALKEWTSTEYNGNT